MVEVNQGVHFMCFAGPLAQHSRCSYDELASYAHVPSEQQSPAPAPQDATAPLQAVSNFQVASATLRRPSLCVSTCLGAHRLPSLIDAHEAAASVSLRDSRLLLRWRLDQRVAWSACVCSPRQRQKRQASTICQKIKWRHSSNACRRGVCAESRRAAVHRLGVQQRV
jgi:hypothetical protein